MRCSQHLLSCSQNLGFSLCPQVAEEVREFFAISFIKGLISSSSKGPTSKCHQMRKKFQHMNSEKTQILTETSLIEKSLNQFGILANSNLETLSTKKSKPIYLTFFSLGILLFAAQNIQIDGQIIDRPLTVWTSTNSKILKEMGIPDHLTCFLRNLYAVQEAKVRTGHGTTDQFQIGKGVHQVCILSPQLFNLYAEYIKRNTGLEEAQTGIKITGRNINNLRYADDTTLMAESEEELKSLLMKVKEESEKLA